ncbi:aminotransferase class V-fold PLP-dependent enzyme [Saccharicrinis fermentans]|uniref:Methionine gamma-lyase n=1 Tax=Saccharicrinis fermentans DSM 9555 = JCM 21142 TaxID=869213 RepID=W7Y6J7_9BACT|nr:aminotransferase class V-fold PLP-dependent enzyme [Saccharicrinis fermentans]GAF03837.1 methionine gamma-lyase [Saccharicrinis fermentans DSM 9555 = JCM 21142]
MTKKQGYTTGALHTPFPKGDVYNSLHMPIYDSVAYEFDTSQDIEEVFTGKEVAHMYSRTSNPTVEYFEKKLKKVTEAKSVVALSSGMAAISNTLLALVEPGGNVVTSDHLFGHTYALLKDTLTSWGIEVKFVDMSQPQEVEMAIDAKTRVLFFETITNPQLEVADITALSTIAHAHRVAVVVDSTLTPPYVFKSSDFGVDVEVMSTTKFISGGAAAVGGAIVDNGVFDWSQMPALTKWSHRFAGNELVSRIRKEIFRHLGACMTAHTAHFMNLGMDILALRVDRCVENCLQLGVFFEKKSKIKSVSYPGLKSHPNYTLSLKQFSGKPGAVMSIDLESKSHCYRLMDALQVVRRATNLNDNKTLIIHPWSTIYAEFSDEEKLKMQNRDTMLRISVGIEDVEDLIADFEMALSKV